MKSKIVSLLLGSALTLATGSLAFALDKTVKIGSLSDQSGVYADVGGTGSTLAAQMAAEDSRLTGKGWKIDILSGDHQNKPDIGTSIVRQWFDLDKVDVVVDVPNSGVALAVSGVVKEKNGVFIASGAASADLTNAQCSRNTVHWTYDTSMLTRSLGQSVARAGGDSWFFLTADYAFGAALERDTTAVIKANGGKVVGGIKHPLNISDFSSFLLQAQASRAKVIGLANAGGDTTNAIKQVAEFGIAAGGQKVVAFFTTMPDIKAMGLSAAQGVTLTESFYWDMNDETRTFSKRFAARMKNSAPPTMVQAGVYAGLMHYFKALEALGGNPHDGIKVVEKMKSMPTDDPLFGRGEIEFNGRAIHPAYVFEVKKPAESKGSWDLYKLVSTIPANQAFTPVDKSTCSLSKTAIVVADVPKDARPPANPDSIAKVTSAPDAKTDKPAQQSPVTAVAPPPVVAVAPPVSPPAVSRLETTKPAGRRVALVVGNASYKNMPALQNPKNDAVDVGRALKALNFETIVATDLDRTGMNDAISRFARTVTDADIALVYYSGHGMQYSGRNFLLPVDARLEGVADVNRFQLTPVEDLVDILGAAKGMQVIILDACRNNPVERDFKNKVASAPGGDRDASSTRGFSRIEVRSGLLVTYATTANSVASDGDGRNSPFTRAFLDNVATPDLEIRQMLYKVQGEVYSATNKRQLPEISSLYIGPDIRLK
jgi:branched-chain amino acid transport system substrate-binding protein